MDSSLNELTSQLTRTAARELDKRLLWDMVCAYADGTPLREMAVGEWPDGSKSVVRRVDVGEVPDVLGPKRKVDVRSSQERITLTVR